jgi:hypothetical protein
MAAATTKIRRKGLNAPLLIVSVTIVLFIPLSV